jgi:hypothetical protein
MASTKKKMAPDENTRKRSAIDDDVEAHGANVKKMSPDGVGGGSKRSAVEDDVEGHGANVKKMSPDGVGGGSKRSAVEDDVEGHMIGTMNPVLARDLARSKDRDIERSVSRNNLVSEAKRGNTTRKP